MPELPERLQGLPSAEWCGVLRVEAVSGVARLKGLAGLDGLAVGVALHFPGTRSLHTFGMRFALDLVWLDGEERVIRVDRAVPRRRLRTCIRARSVLELAAGGADAMSGLVAPPLDN